MVTNAAAIGELMIEPNDNQVILTGGVLPEGNQDLDWFRRGTVPEPVSNKQAIVGASGIIVEEGCFSAIPQEAEIKTVISTYGLGQTILVADSSKIGARAFTFFCDFTHVDKLVTDKNIGKAALEELKHQGVEVFAV